MLDKLGTFGLLCIVNKTEKTTRPKAKKIIREIDAGTRTQWGKETKDRTPNKGWYNLYTIFCTKSIYIETEIILENIVAWLLSKNEESSQDHIFYYKWIFQ